MHTQMYIAFVMFLYSWMRGCDGIEDISDQHLEGLANKWVNEMLPQINSDHSGDCTKQPWSCMRCWFVKESEFADRVLIAIDKAKKEKQLNENKVLHP